MRLAKNHDAGQTRGDPMGQQGCEQYRQHQ